MERKKLLGITASPRKVGNTEIVIKAAAAKLDGWDLSMIRLPSLRILPCKGCYACLLPGVRCNLKDDMQWLLERIVEADAVIFAAPDYVLGPVGIMKMVADRTLQTFPYNDRLSRMKAAVALTLGREDYRGYADTALAAQVGALGFNVTGLEIFYGTHPGEVALDNDFDVKIERLARSLVLEKQYLPLLSNRCPRCHSDLFRIREDGFECAVCKSMATQEGSLLRFHYFHPEFGDEGKLEHMKWLAGKKEEYASLKDKLKEVQNTYREGKWLTPGGDV